MNITDAIVQIDNLFNKELIKRIISYINTTELKPLHVSKGLDLNIRNVEGCTLNKNKNMTERILLPYITEEISKVMINYTARFKNIELQKVNQVDLLKYNPGGKYEIHMDEGPTTFRRLSCIVNLNEDYKGGDLNFYDVSYKNIIKKIKLKSGSTVFFPSNFLYPHKIEPITKGTRYSLVAWLI